MTTAEEVDEFVATGVDVLAPAFGNIHGEYGPRGPQLDFERLVKDRTPSNIVYLYVVVPDLRRSASRRMGASTLLSTGPMGLSQN